jgi:hypothetical protein
MRLNHCTVETFAGPTSIWPRSSSPSDTTSPTSRNSPSDPLQQSNSRSTKSKTLLPPAPPKPAPWTWRCHICGSLYRLGVTRRCLNDGHIFCTSTASLAGKEESISRLGAESNNDHDHNNKSTRKRKRRERQTEACQNEFDYSGWAAYNEWRRNVRRGIEADYSMSGWRGKRRKWDCLGDCDYPSECGDILSHKE